MNSEHLLTPPQNENLDSKIRHLQASELKFYDVRRAQIFNISNICWGLFEKRPFMFFDPCWVYTSFIMGRFWFFWGGVQKSLHVHDISESDILLSGGVYV